MMIIKLIIRIRLRIITIPPTQKKKKNNQTTPEYLMPQMT